MKPCKPNQIRNPKTNRCVDINGKIGRKLVAAPQKPVAAPRKPVALSNI